MTEQDIAEGRRLVTAMGPAHWRADTESTPDAAAVAWLANHAHDLLDAAERAGRYQQALAAALAGLESANSEEAEWAGDTLEMTREAMLGMRAALGLKGWDDDAE